MKLALSMLCENPRRRTGLTTLFHEFVSRSLPLYPDLHWLLFAGPDQEWRVDDPRVQLVREFPANDRLKRRLLADHIQVPARARALGADALLTIGFVPMRKLLPTVMHVFSLQHLDKSNRIGLGRQLYRRWMTNYSWPTADLVITNSRFARSQLVVSCPGLADRIVQSYEGLQHEQFKPEPEPGEIESLRSEFRLRPGYLLWVSNFYPYKQAHLLIKGFAALEPGLRERHPLVMVGGSWEGVLEAARVQAQMLGVADQVRFFEWVDDRWLAPLYRHASAFCLASREETFGRCVIEAMACGAPCIVNDLPIMREVTDGNALIIDFRDAQAVTSALESLCLDSMLAARLRAGGLSRARDFSFEKLTSERIDAIRKLLAGRNPRSDCR